jgi:hypothetical protein
MFYEINKIIAQIAAMKVIDRDAPAVDRDAPAVVENLESYQEHKRIRRDFPLGTLCPQRRILQFKQS